MPVLRTTERSSYPICIVQDNYVVHVNTSGLKILGAATATEVVGRHVVDFVDADSASRLLAFPSCDIDDVLEAELAPWALKRLTGDRVDAEVTLAHTSWRGQLALLVVLRELPHPATPAWTRGSGSLLSEAISAMSEGVLIVFPNGEVHTINAAAVRILGGNEALIRDGLRGRHTQYVVPVRDGHGASVAPNDLPHQQARRSQAAGIFELELAHPDGTSVWIRGKSHPIDPSDPNSPIITTFRDVSAERETLRQLRHQATHDRLTGLPDRGLVRQILQTAVDDDDRAVFSVLFIDLDNLKTINDSRGHGAGDAALKIVGERILHVVPSQSTVGRLGGDEFVVILAGDADLVYSTSNKLHATLSTPISVDHPTITVRASIGALVVGTADTRSVDDLLRDADRAMYTAKMSGGNRTVRFESEFVQQPIDRAKNWRRATTHDTRL